MIFTTRQFFLPRGRKRKSWCRRESALNPRPAYTEQANFTTPYVQKCPSRPRFRTKRTFQPLCIWRQRVYIGLIMLRALSVVSMSNIFSNSAAGDLAASQNTPTCIIATTRIFPFSLGQRAIQLKGDVRTGLPTVDQRALDQMALAQTPRAILRKPELEGIILVVRTDSTVHRVLATHPNKTRVLAKRGET